MTDLHQFVLSSYDTLSHSTTHVYISALAWLPEDPLRAMLSCMKSDTLICTGQSKDWPSMLWVATLGGIVRHVVFSLDDQSIAACSRDGTITFRQE